MELTGKEVDLRATLADITHSELRIAELDAKIWKLQKQRDKHVAHVGVMRAHIDALKKEK